MSVYEQDKWDRRMLELAKHVGQWSKDPSTKCGAVVAQGGRQVVGLGYNGFPVGIEDTAERLNDREQKYAMTVHAEINAILMAAKDAMGGTLYIHPLFPCNECAKVAVQAGIMEIVTYEMPPDTIERWAKSWEIARTLFREAHVGFRTVKL